MPFTNVLEPKSPQPAINPRTELEVDPKPLLESYDSAQECSFARLVRLYELLEIEDQEIDRCVFDDSCLNVA